MTMRSPGCTVPRPGVTSTVSPRRQKENRTAPDATPGTSARSARRSTETVRSVSPAVRITVAPDARPIV